MRMYSWQLRSLGHEFRHLPRFLEGRSPRLVRRGTFWIPGERVDIDGQTYQRGPLFAEWEAPEK